MIFTLNNGVTLPAIGFGTYLATDGNGEQTIIDALEVGYRYFDTASFYHNEEEIGHALRKAGIPREELFLSSKVWKTQMGYEETKKAFQESLEKLGTEYLDMYLIHWPKETAQDPEWKKKIQDTWRAMEEFYEAGKVRAIGLSNFLPHHIMALKETAKVQPMVNQLELHVGYMQEYALAYCKENDIVVQAWSPLGRRRMLEDANVIRMATDYQVTPAMLLLRYLMQRELVVIPKASSKERMKENLEIPEFVISPEDMAFLSCIPQQGWSGEHPDFDKK